MKTVNLRNAIYQAGVSPEQTMVILDALENDVLNDIATKAELETGLSRLEATMDQRFSEHMKGIELLFAKHESLMFKELGNLKGEIGSVKADLTWKIHQALGLGVLLVLFFNILPSLLKSLGFIG